MKKIIFTIIFINICSNVQAMWVRMTDCELINKSVLIVEAEFKGKTVIQLPMSLLTAEPGVLAVSNYIKGYSKKADLLIDQPKPPISSSDIFFNKGQKGIWFLTEGKNTNVGIYYANHPQRFRPLEDIKSIHNLINSCPK